MTKVW